MDAQQPEDVRRAHFRADDQAGAEIGPQAAVLVALQGGLVVRRVVRLVRVSARPSVSCFEPYTELAKKVCPRLRDLATAPAGGITQPRTYFFWPSLYILIGTDMVARSFFTIEHQHHH